MEALDFNKDFLIGKHVRHIGTEYRSKLGSLATVISYKEGVVASIGTQTKNGKRVGVNTFSTEDKLETYGVYVASPIRLEGSKVFITPQSQLDHYRDTDSVVGSLGAGVEHHFTNTLRLEGIALAHKGFNDTDVKGETYTVKLTKTF